MPTEIEVCNSDYDVVETDESSESGLTTGQSFVLGGLTALTAMGIVRLVKFGYRKLTEPKNGGKRKHLKIILADDDECENSDDVVEDRDIPED
jgi:hypothetical protein